MQCPHCGGEFVIEQTQKVFFEKQTFFEAQEYFLVVAAPSRKAVFLFVEKNSSPGDSLRYEFCEMALKGLRWSDILDREEWSEHLENIQQAEKKANVVLDRDGKVTYHSERKRSWSRGGKEIGFDSPPKRKKTKSPSKKFMIHFEDLFSYEITVAAPEEILICNFERKHEYARSLEMGSGRINQILEVASKYKAKVTIDEKGEVVQKFSK